MASNLKDDKIRAIDGMKGISTIGIVIYHYGHFRPVNYPYDSILKLVYAYGHYLVDLFFIISGFLFAKNYLSKIINNEISCSNFIAHRMLKLWPLYLLTTAVTAVGQWILLYCTGSTFCHGADLYSLLLNIAGLQHAGLGNELAFNGPAWYLSVLIICYVVNYVTCRHHIFLRGGVLCLALYRCNLSAPLLQQQIFRGLLGFFMGRVCYIAWQKFEKRHLRNFAAIVLILNIILWLAFKKTEINIFGDALLYFILAVWPAFFLLCLTSGAVNKIMSGKIFLWLNKISYSLYLWHFPVEVLLVVYNYFSCYELDFNLPGTWIIRMLLSVFAAVVSCYLIEPYLNKTASKILMY